MKRNYAGAVLFLCMLYRAGAVWAAPVGNPSQPVISNFHDTPVSICAEGEFVSERELDNAANETSFKGAWTAGKLNVTWYDKLDTYVLLGAFDWSVRDKRPNGTDLRFMSNSEYAWGYGSKYLLYEAKNGFSVGLDGRYRQSKPDINKIRLNGITYARTNGAAAYKEWQLALGAALDMSKFIHGPQSMRFIPYAGVKYNRVNFEAFGTVSGTRYEIRDAKQENSLGLFLGCDLYFAEVPKDEEVGLNLEMRAGDELAFSEALSYRF